MRPRWVDIEEYSEWDKSQYVVLNRKAHVPEVLIASKGYAWLLGYYYTVNGLYRTRNTVLRWMHRRGIIKIDYSEMVTFHTLKKWFIAARKG